MLGKILIGIASVLVLFVAVVAARPAAYRVERKTQVAAPPDAVFAVLNDLRQFAGVYVLFGSPLEQSDPGLQKTFAGPAAGVGQSFAWSGKEAGQGTLTIEESVPGQRVGMKLHFVKPMESTATYALNVTETATGSAVTWSMEGNHNFIGKAFGLLMNMDRMLAADLEKGLAELRTVAESKTAPAPAQAATGN